MNKIVIIGSGGHGRVVADMARACGYEEVVFLDDADTPLSNGRVSEYVHYKKDHCFVVAIGNSMIREKGAWCHESVYRYRSGYLGGKAAADG